MSEGLIDANAAARFINVAPKELQKLVADGVIHKSNGKFHPVQLVHSYVNHIRDEIVRKMENPTQVEIAKHLSMSERNLRDVLRRLSLDHRTSTLDEIREEYLRDIRETAAGRGGDEQQSLTKARTEESEIKAAKLRVEFHREIGSVIYTKDAASVISLWCRQANIDYTQGFNKLVSEIQSRYNLKVDNEMVDEIVKPTTERIKSHAEKLGESLVEGIDDFSEAESSSHI